MRKLSTGVSLSGRELEKWTFIVLQHALLFLKIKYFLSLMACSYFNRLTYFSVHSLSVFHSLRSFNLRLPYLKNGSLDFLFIIVFS